MNRDAIRATIIEYTGECRCDPAYSERRLRDPQCLFCQVDVEDLADDLAAL